LRASISVTGRSIVLYEECHPKKKENNPIVHQQFLNNLKTILPDCATPIIVTDAGFRAPWFKAVRQMGWHFVGRLRNKNLIFVEDTKTWQLSSIFFEHATGTPTHYGLGLKNSLTRTPERMAILLLIAAIATFAAWLSGIIAKLSVERLIFRPILPNLLDLYR